MSFGSNRDATYQMTRLANTLDEMNRKLTRALLDLERINRRLDAEKAQAEAAEHARTADAEGEPPRAKAAS
jgi:hypothetical protein